MEKVLVISTMLITLCISVLAEKPTPPDFSIDSVGRPANLKNFREDTNKKGSDLPKIFRRINSTDANRNKKGETLNEIALGFSNSRDTQFVINYRRGKFNGQWTSWFKNRQVCDSGLLINDIPDGMWKGWYRNGNPRYILHFNERKLHGLKNELINQPKTKYFILAQKPVAEATRHYDARLLFGHQSANSQKFILSKQVNHASYSPKLLQKLVAENTGEGSSSTYTAPFTEGLLHGEFTSFYSGGGIKERGLYLNGLREGIWEEFTIHKEKSIGTYRHGYRNGEWRYYDADNKLLYWKLFDAKGNETGRFIFANRQD
jgi:antitoxin component YwqK of YwqJK toxin-antitoxin module